MKSEYGRSHHTAAGNAMIYVLIGIILFAALSFALTRIGRSSSTMSLEQASLYAQQITSYAEKMDGAIQNVMLQNRCNASEISFENTSLGGYINAASPTNNKCHVFDSKGGGMLYTAPPAAALDTVAAAASGFPAGGLLGDYFFAGNICVDKAGTGEYGTCAADSVANEDLVMILPWVSLEVCTAINATLGNTGALPADAGGSYNTTKFTGTYADAYAIGNAGFTANTAGCYQSNAATPGAGYHFYQVLVAR